MKLLTRPERFTQKYMMITKQALKTDTSLAEVDLRKKNRQGVEEIGRYAVPGYLLGKEQSERTETITKGGRYH